MEKKNQQTLTVLNIMHIYKKALKLRIQLYRHCLSCVCLPFPTVNLWILSLHAHGQLPSTSIPDFVGRETCHLIKRNFTFRQYNPSISCQWPRPSYIKMALWRFSTSKSSKIICNSGIQAVTGRIVPLPLKRCPQLVWYGCLAGTLSQERASLPTSTPLAWLLEDSSRVSACL